MSKTEELIKTEEYGLATWEEEFPTANSRKNFSNDEFMRLENGHNRLRIVTPPFGYFSHRYKAHADDSGFGRKIKCGLIEGDNCPLCDLGIRRGRRYYIGVIDRDSGTYKILDMAKSVYQGIQKFSRDEDWGSPMDYDIDIVMDSEAGSQGWYTVVPKPAKPLSEEDIEIKNNDVDLDALINRCTPLKKEYILKNMKEVQDSSKNYVEPKPVSSVSVEEKAYDFTERT